MTASATLLARSGVHLWSFNGVDQKIKTTIGVLKGTSETTQIYEAWASFREFLTPESVQHFIELLKETALEGSSGPCELSLNYNGIRRHYRVSAELKREGSSKGEVHGTFYDTTILHETKETVETAARMLDAFINHSPTGICIVGADERILKCNKRFLRIAELPPQLELKGQPLGLLDAKRLRDLAQRTRMHLRSADIIVSETVSSLSASGAVLSAEFFEWLDRRGKRGGVVVSISTPQFGVRQSWR